MADNRSIHATSNDSGLQRPISPDSPEESSKLPVSKRLRRRGPKPGSDRISFVSRAGEGSRPGPIPERRRVSAGSATDPIILGDGEQEPPGNITEQATSADLETPSPSVRASNELSNLSTPATPSPLNRKSKSAPIVPRIGSNSGKRPSPKINLSAKELDSKLANTVRKALAKSDLNNTIIGSNYLFTVINPGVTEENLIKFGISKEATSKRLSQILSNCKHIVLQELNPNQRQIRLYKRAEALIKADLSNIIHEFECPNCRVWHHEYFTASADVALEVTQRWTAFCEKEPWDENGHLHPFWAQRLLNREVCCEDEDDYVRRAARWSRFINASWWDRATYNATCLGESVWPHRWQLVCSIQTVYLVCVTFPNAWIILIGWILHFIMFLDFTFESTCFITMFSQRRSLGHKRNLSSDTSSTMNENDFMVEDDGITDAFRDDEILEPEDIGQGMDIDGWKL